jgi:hypothetical protein
LNQEKAGAHAPTFCLQEFVLSYPNQRSASSLPAALPALVFV